MRIVVLIANPCVNDARVIREAEALAEAGHDVVVYAAWRSGLPVEERRNGVVYRRKPIRALDAVMKLGEDGARSGPGAAHTSKPRRTLIDLYMAARGATRWIRPLISEAVTPTVIEIMRNRYYFRDAGAAKPDIVHAHELAMLLAGSRIARSTGAKVVYDSHELETGRNGVWGRWEKWIRGRAERWLIGRADRVITVSDSIAEHLEQMYAIDRPTVVLNSPAIGEATSDTPARSLRHELGLGSGVPLAVYIGSVTRNRGLEQCVESLVHAPEIHIAAVGPREPDVEARLATMARQLGVSDRFHLVDPVPHAEVTSYVRSASASLIMIQDVCLSYRYCFPNKLLESMLAGLPIVAARLVELERMIERTGAGLTVDQTDPKAIADGIQQVVAQRARYAPGPELIQNIAATYGWQVQKKKIVALFEELGADGEGGRR